MLYRGCLFDCFVGQFGVGLAVRVCVWASNIRPEAVLQLTQMDVHSLAKNRVNVTLPHVTEFVEAWGVKEGNGMWIAPADRVVLW